ncbi:MAG TPA: hypothetical protein VMI54_13860 [Polyangiaceae bacterium]|nr:hypothetical protein [Polyangiaceae bacterium]
MVQVLGTTYRIVETRSAHEVVRLLDDRSVGSFRCDPTLTIVESRIAPELLRQVAREAIREARVERRFLRAS